MKSFLQLTDNVGEIRYSPVGRGSSMYVRSIASHSFRSSLKSNRYRCSFPSMSTRKKLKRNCRLSFVFGRENGLIVKSRVSWPTFR